MLVIADGILAQNAQGSDDTGGNVRLLRSDAEEGPYTTVDTQPWLFEFEWGPVTEIPDGWYVGQEIGNGVTYAGESPYSTALELGGP